MPVRGGVVVHKSISPCLGPRTRRLRGQYLTPPEVLPKKAGVLAVRARLEKTLYYTKTGINGEDFARSWTRGIMMIVTIQRTARGSPGIRMERNSSKSGTSTRPIPAPFSARPPPFSCPMRTRPVW